MLAVGMQQHRQCLTRLRILTFDGKTRSDESQERHSLVARGFGMRDCVWGVPVSFQRADRVIEAYWDDQECQGRPLAVLCVSRQSYAGFAVKTHNEAVSGCQP